jgi:hypothetical protein
MVSKVVKEVFNQFNTCLQVRDGKNAMGSKLVTIMYH